MLLTGVGDGCLQSLAVLQKAPAVPKVNLAVQTFLQGGDTAVQGVLVTPAAMNARSCFKPLRSQESLYTTSTALFACVSSEAMNAGNRIMRR